jgi:hypothetical protein
MMRLIPLALASDHIAGGLEASTKVRETTVIEIVHLNDRPSYSLLRIEWC